MSSGWRQCLNPSRCRSCSGWLDCHCCGRLHYRSEKDSRRIPDPLNPDGTRTLKNIHEVPKLGPWLSRSDWQNKVHSGPTSSYIERSQTHHFDRFLSLILESHRGPLWHHKNVWFAVVFLRTLFWVERAKQLLIIGWIHWPGTQCYWKMHYFLKFWNVAMMLGRRG